MADVILATDISPSTYRCVIADASRSTANPCMCRKPRNPALS
jgi:hypothetical protein